MRAVLWLALLSVLAAGETPREGPSVDLRHGDLKVSENRRFLVHADGTPFFWLGDTAWEFFHRLNREEAERYLENRRRKGFTVIQAVALGELDGLGVGNAYGDRPLEGRDPAKPNDAYFRHVDFIVAKAAEKGIFIGMLPTWGSHVADRGAIFNAENARIYGRFLGSRYAEAPNIIWILGGDRPPEKHVPVWRAMAEGIREGDGGRHLKTYHPRGGASSSAVLHDETWLDFNMLQSGHGAKDIANWRKIAADYARKPVKPCLDGEPRYEDHPVNWRAENGWFDDVDVRQGAYWALFAGAHGHTYGCHPIWMMWDAGPDKPRRMPSPVRHKWTEVLDLDGAWDMMHARSLLESRPFLSRVPDAALVAEGQGDGPDHVEACRGDGYLLAYIPTGKPVTVRLGTIGGGRIKAWWFDPRAGKATEIEEMAKKETARFTPPGAPGRGNDWVLVVDDAAKDFPPPGAR
ncbi:MAG: glycoside hydrolase family 140 protein [Planctomycetes bacterium]|nr:glycoside hydrolase family 140 protein [Planctomycetota bacterium]